MVQEPLRQTKSSRLGFCMGVRALGKKEGMFRRKGANGGGALGPVAWLGRGGVSTSRALFTNQKHKKTSNWPEWPMGRLLASGQARRKRRT